MNKNKYLFWLVCLTAVVIGGCKGFKTTKLGHFYHNMTAHYNVYFNAREKLKEVEAKLYDANDDNYSNIIAIYPIGTQSGAKSASGDLDIVIKKCTKLIKKHDVSDWVDDAYLLMGKATYYKRDYYAAIEIFEYVVQKYGKELTGKEAQLWLARCYLELNKLPDALAQIGVAKTFKDLPEPLQAQYNEVQADYYIRSEEYNFAAEKLEKALPNVSSRKYRIRYYFILGQLYAKTGNVKKSTKFYNEVIHRISPYELSFQAKMGLADSYEEQTSRGKKDIKEFLFKLTKDPKNAQYLDQVYYHLGNIELKEGNLSKAVFYYKVSAKKSTKNKFQKALSYNTLADLYFKKPDYKSAKQYYDSAAGVATKDFPNYEQFKKKQKTLSDLIANLIVIQREDSLQKLALLPQSVLDKYVDMVIAQEKQDAEDKKRDLEEQKKEALQQQSQQSDVVNQQQNFAPNFDNQTNAANSNTGTSAVVDPTAIFGNTSNGFYFDNPTLVANGAADFVRKWGRRPLQDDWRRRTKGTITDNPANTQVSTKNGNNQLQTSGSDSTQGTNAVPKGGVADKAIDIPANKAQYYKDIPYTKGQINFSNRKIEDALYNAATIYYDQLNQEPKAALLYEDLVSRFPDGKYLLKAHFYLYKIYGDLNDSVKRDEHKNFILKNYPGSEYAILIKSPELLRQKLARKKNLQLEELYKKTYSSYQSDKCDEVLANFTSSLQIEPNYLLPKFDYLRAVCPLKHDTSSRILDTLKAYMQRYPGDEMAGEATKLYKFLTDRRLAERNPHKDSAKAERPSPYKKNDSVTHYYLFVFPLLKTDLTKVKSAFSDFNRDNFASENLEIISMVIGKNNAVLIRNFADEKRTLNYYKNLGRTNELYDKLSLPSHQEFIISDENLKILQQDKDVDLYLKFFKANYQ